MAQEGNKNSSEEKILVDDNLWPLDTNLTETKENNSDELIEP